MNHGNPEGRFAAKAHADHSPALACRALVKAFGEPPVQVVRGISLEIQAGEFMAITGRSGSGKSTLLYLLSGLDTCTSGEVIIDGQILRDMDSAEFDRFRNERMGFVFQFHYLLPELTALENVLMPCRRAGIHQEKREQALSLLEEFEVAYCADKIPAKMSGGEMQRVAIARALIMQPRFLFADEPTGNLDSQNGERVMQIFHRINSSLGTTILMVTHESDYAARASRQIHLVDGEIRG